MCWYHWVALFVATLSFALWVAAKFGADVSELLMIPFFFLDF